MPSFPMLSEGRVIDTVGGDASISDIGMAFRPIASVTTNTKGSWTELFSAVPVGSDGLWLSIGEGSPADFLFDIGIGAVSSEVAVISNIQYSRPLGGSGYKDGLFIPLAIPKGVRLSARVQSTLSSADLRVQPVLCGSAFGTIQGSHKVVTYGANTADSGGTSIDPGGTIHTKGSYSQITASVTHDIKWLVICIGGQHNTDRATASWLVDVAIGGAGSEVVIISNFAISTGINTDKIFPQYISLPCSIPKDSRIAVRAQCSINDAADRLFDVVMLGVS